jgi:hypothetical protein
MKKFYHAERPRCTRNHPWVVKVDITGEFVVRDGRSTVYCSPNYKRGNDKQARIFTIKETPDWIAEAWDNNKCVVIISAELLPDNKVEFYGYHEDMEVIQSIIVGRKENKYTNTASMVVYKEVVYRYINVYKTESGVIVEDCCEEHSPVYRKYILSKEDYQRFVHENPLPPVVKETYETRASFTPRRYSSPSLINKTIEYSQTLLYTTPIVRVIPYYDIENDSYCIKYKREESRIVQTKDIHEVLAILDIHMDNVEYQNGEKIYTYTLHLIDGRSIQMKSIYK